MNAKIILGIMCALALSSALIACSVAVSIDRTCDLRVGDAQGVVGGVNLTAIEYVDQGDFYYVGTPYDFTVAPKEYAGQDVELSLTICSQNITIGDVALSYWNGTAWHTVTDSEWTCDWTGLTVSGIKLGEGVEFILTYNELGTYSMQIMAVSA